MWQRSSLLAENIAGLQFPALSVVSQDEAELSPPSWEQERCGPRPGQADGNPYLRVSPLSP